MDLEPDQCHALGFTHSIRSTIPIGGRLSERFEHAYGTGDLAVTDRRKGDLLTPAPGTGPVL